MCRPRDAGPWLPASLRPGVAQVVFQVAATVALLGQVVLPRLGARCRQLPQVQGLEEGLEEREGISLSRLPPEPGQP